MIILGGLVILAASFAVTMAKPEQETIIKTVIEVGGHTAVEATFTISTVESPQNETTGVILQRVNEFSPTFYEELASSNPGNLITSPFCTFIGLSIIAYGSSGETEKELQRILNLPDKSVGRIGFANLIDTINDAEDVELRIANRLYINEKYSINPAYHELVQTTFRSSFESLNFSSSKVVADTINEWVGEFTNNRIVDRFMPYAFNPETQIVFLNAIYFKAFWGGPFKKLEGDDKPFHVTTSKVQNVPIIHRFGFYKYGEIPQLKATLVELPYEADEFSMIIILPQRIDGLDEVEKLLVQQDLLELIETVNITGVEVSLPKFKIEATLDLIPPLKNMGVKRAFNKYVAQFSEIFETGIYIDHFVQKAFIEVDEKGTEAGVLLNRLPQASPMQIPRKAIFYVDHPFYLTIIKKDKLTNKKFELFSARVVDPLE